MSASYSRTDRMSALARLIRLRRIAIERHDLVALILLDQRIRHAHV